MNDIKKAARLIIDTKENLALIINFLKSYNLMVEFSSFKYIIEEDSNKTIYTSCPKPVNLNYKKKGYLYLYISKSKKLSRLAKVCEEHQHSDQFGRILGYPECCISFYNKHIQSCVKKKKDLIFTVLEETRSDFPFPFWNNIAVKYFDVILLSHYPCSFSCAASIEIARERLRLIRSVDPYYAQYISMQLKSTVIITNSLGIYKINDFFLKDSELYFNNKTIVCVNRCYIGEIIKECTKLQIVSKKRILFLNGKKVLKDLKGRTIGVFIFQ